ncbi:6-phosphogluconate dehydrogenase [archaeon]|nr:6-phosphogluconate dehydrogenase [archaeon]
MKIGIIGLGKMGFPMAENLLEKEFTVVGYDVITESVDTLATKGAQPASSVQELCGKLEAPRVILLSLPASVVDTVLDELKTCLSQGDIIIESGNSFYKDSQQRAATLREKGICMLDVGISGGVYAARNGACCMIGGDREIFDKTEFVFKALSWNGSYKYLGKSGTGHLVKGYHNFVEYGYMQALAEGFMTLEKVSEKESLGINLRDICDIWNNGSIVESRLLDYTKKALETYGDLATIPGSVKGQTQSEMEILARIADNMGVSVPACKAAITFRTQSLAKPSRIGKLLNGMRNMFGGHQEWK